MRAEDDAGGDVFVGIARAADAANYLAGVQHSVITGPFAASTRDVRGEAPVMLPAQADVWAASAVGPGVQSAQLTAQPGSWVLVTMPADGSAGLRARVDVAATLPWLTPAGGALTALGAVLLLGGAAAIGLAVRAASTEGGG